MSDVNNLDEIFDGEVVEANESTAIIKVDTALQVVEAERQVMNRLRNDVFIEGVHFGRVPGVDKPFLWQPGAEALMSAFNLWPEYEIVDKHVDWNPDNPFYYIQMRCILHKVGTNEVVATAIASGNSREKTFAKQGGRKCPQCEKTTIYQSKQPSQDGSYGFFCWSKKGGCGAQFPADDVRITSQTAGVDATEVFSSLHGIDMRVTKRCFVAAIIKACRASREYTPGEGIDREQAMKRPLSKDEVRLLVEKWTPMFGAETKDHLVKAVGPSNQWMDGPDAADRAIIRYIASQK